MPKDDQQQQDLFFVQVTNKAEIRRSILESLRDILHTLEKFNKFKHLREKKLKKIEELRTLVRETNKATLDLKNLLPDAHVKIPSAKKKREKKAPSKLASGASQEPQQKKKSELDSLEHELAAIEKKLEKLS